MPVRKFKPIVILWVVFMLIPLQSVLDYVKTGCVDPTFGVVSTPYKSCGDEALSRIGYQIFTVVFFGICIFIAYKRQQKKLSKGK